MVIFYSVDLFIVREYAGVLIVVCYISDIKLVMELLDNEGFLGLVLIISEYFPITVNEIESIFLDFNKVNLVPLFLQLIYPHRHPPHLRHKLPPSDKITHIKKIISYKTN